MFPSVAHNVPTMAGSGECSHFMDQGFSKRYFSNDTQGVWGRDVVRAVAACIVHDPRRCTPLREVGFMILNVTHYSEHCLFFKKKKILLNHSKSLSLSWLFIPFSPKPPLCVCVLSVREAALPVFLVWCGTSPPQQLRLPSFWVCSSQGYYLFVVLLFTCCFFCLFVCLRRDLR